MVADAADLYVLPPAISYNLTMSSTPNKPIDISMLPPVSIDRMVNAVEKVKQRLLRTTAVLQKADVPFAVIGDNAVAAWVSRVDEAAVRNTADVDILIRRADFDRVRVAMEADGFVFGQSMNVDFFLDGPDGKIRDAVHLLYASEKVKEQYASTTPSLDHVDTQGQFPIVQLEDLVRMKLTSFRDKDRMHLRDMIGIEIIDDSWPARFSPELGTRLQQLLDDPDG